MKICANCHHSKKERGMLLCLLHQTEVIGFETCKDHNQLLTLFDKRELLMKEKKDE